MPFTIYDENFNKLDYPVGVKPLDFLVSSISKERIIENVNGLPGNVDYGFDYKEREITLSFWLRHYHGEHDNKLLKSELYAMLDSSPHFFISDDKLPTRVLKVNIDESYIPERIMYSPFSNLEVKGTVSGLPFWRTKYTTKDIQNQGYQAMAEQFGMADGLNIDLTSYSYTTSTFSVWNGGNVAIDPRNMPLVITLYGVTSTNNFTVENLTTGEKFIAQRTLTDHTVTLQGTMFLLNNLNRLRECNRKFISLAPGENKIKISNGTFKKVDFEFPFFYK